MANEISSKWDYPLIDISMDRRTSLPGVKDDYAGELTGVEGSLQGGLRPFAGFKEVHDLDCTSNENHNLQSTAIDFFPINFTIDFTFYGYGFVYRMKRPDSDLADVFADFYLSSCDEWSKGNLLMSGVSTTEVMDVESTGRTTVVAISGQSPVVFFVTSVTYTDVSSYDNVYCLESTSSSSTPTSEEEKTCMEQYYLIIEDNPGPGLRPKILDVYSGLDEMFKIPVPSDKERPAQGGVILSTSLIDAGYFRKRSTPLYEGTYTEATLLSRTDAEIQTAINSTYPGFSSECENSQSDSFDCFDVNSTNEVKYIGSYPGGRYHPDALIEDAEYCVIDPNSIPSGSSINQLPIMRFYFYINESRDVRNLAFDIKFKRTDYSSEDDGIYSSVVTGASFVLDAGDPNDIWQISTGSKGGQYYSYAGNTGRNKRVVCKEVAGFASDMPGFTCYVAWINTEYMHECDYFTPGEYEAFAVLRKICCDVALPKPSTTAAFNVAPVVCKWGVTEEGEQTEGRQELLKGVYAFAYQLYDSRTGRKSALSERISTEPTDFSANKNYAHMELVYDRNKYDMAYMYRSVNTEVLGAGVGAVLSLDRIIRLADYQIEGYIPTDDSFDRAVYPYKHDDTVIAMQQVYNAESPVFDEKMPYGGRLEWFNGTLLMSKIKNSPTSSGEEIRDGEGIRGIGELR